MWWCSNTESVPLLVSNTVTHDIILVRTEYVLVCTSLYDYTFPVPVCTRYVLVRTVILSVRTKYPDPVPLFTIPDGRHVATLRREMPEEVASASQRPMLELRSVQNDGTGEKIKLRMVCLLHR